MSNHDEELKGGAVIKAVFWSLAALLGFLIVFAYLGASFFTTDSGNSQADTEVKARIAPAGQLALGDPIGLRKPEEIYNDVCMSCHAAGSGGVPKVGDKAAWSGRIAQGVDTLVTHAINGLNAMPARGGGSDLTDEEVKRAVVYIANQSGANFPVSAVTAAVASSATPAAASSSVPAVAPAVIPPADAAPAAAPSVNGKAVFDSACMACHSTGAAGAPKLGDKAAWSARIAKGADTLHKHTLEGFNAMPAKGGNAGLSDAEVKAAVDYMIAGSK